MLLDRPQLERFPQLVPASQGKGQKVSTSSDADSMLH